MSVTYSRRTVAQNIFESPPESPGVAVARRVWQCTWDQVIHYESLVMTFSQCTSDQVIHYESLVVTYSQCTSDQWYGILEFNVPLDTV